MLKTIYEKLYFYGLLVLKIIHTLSSKFVGKKGDSNNLQIIVLWNSWLIQFLQTSRLFSKLERFLIKVK